MPKVVVIVEDTRSVAVSLAVALENIPDVKAAIVEHPRAALRLFTNTEIPFAAMITDLHLPYLDGLELIREIRNMSRYRTLPTILITGDERADVVNGHRPDGPNAIFRKPFSVKEVCRVVEGLLR